MSEITVKHREGTLLQGSQSEDHARILAFLTDHLVGRTFDGLPAIQAILATWPEQGGNATRFHKEMSINPTKMTIFAGSGVGGDFEVATIEPVST